MRYCFVVNNNRSKKWIKFTQCSCSSKSRSWKVFPRGGFLCFAKGKCFAPDTGTGTSTWHQLLQRTTRQVKLTPEGMTYYQRAKDVLSNLSELDGLFQQDATSISGKLRHRHPVRNREKAYYCRACRISLSASGIELELSSHDRPVDILHDGFDCVIRTGALPEDGVIARSLGKLTMVNCASPHYLTRFGYPQSPDDLTSHAIVRYTPHGCTSVRF